MEVALEGSPEHPRLPAENKSETEKAVKPAHHLLGDVEVVRGLDGEAYLLDNRGGKRVALRNRSKAAGVLLRVLAREKDGTFLKRAEQAELESVVDGLAEACAQPVPVWQRVGQLADGVEIDVGDDSNKRVRITTAGVEIVNDSMTLFCRSPHAKPLAPPAPEGELSLLEQYLPITNEGKWLFIGWVTYTLTRPKVDQSTYVILVITGAQGSGKTVLCRLAQQLIDPNQARPQVLPTNVKDLAIATRHAHVAVFDNMRAISPFMADALCVAASGGSIAGRRLYTDAEQQIIHLHGAVVLNGIHSLIDQPDLAQRCLHLHLKPMPDGDRRREEDIQRELHRDLPEIMRGLYEFAAKVLRAFPHAEVTSPHRMYDFVQWLAAMEAVTGKPFLQEMFAKAQKQGQRDALLENILSAKVLEFAEKHGEWSGTPTQLLEALNAFVSPGVHRSREWPSNPIALSRRLVPMQPALAEQGIALHFGRGDERTITITKKGVY